MTRTLLECVTSGFPGFVFHPAALEGNTTRSLLRDLDTMGVAPELAHRIVRMVMAALRLALDADDVSMEDKTAACLVAERVMAATVVAILAERLQPPPPAND
jgi:hypothetical protein